MNINEIRVGNIIKQGRIISFVENGVKVSSKEIYNLKDLEPERLTEEVLLVYGAKRVISEPPIPNRFEFNETLLRLMFANGEWHCSIGDDKSGFMFRRIKYIHDFQNLYYGLTGEEAK